MKKMFTLKGVANCGKTEKIKQIAHWVITTYPYHISTSIVKSILLSSGDIFGVLQIDKLKIGFVSSGDEMACVSGNDELLRIHTD